MLRSQTSPICTHLSWTITERRFWTAIELTRDNSSSSACASGGDYCIGRSTIPSWNADCLNFPFGCTWISIPMSGTIILNNCPMAGFSKLSSSSSTQESPQAALLHHQAPDLPGQAGQPALSKTHQERAGGSNGDGDHGQRHGSTLGSANNLGRDSTSLNASCPCRGGGTLNFD